MRKPGRIDTILTEEIAFIAKLLPVNTGDSTRRE